MPRRQGQRKVLAKRKRSKLALAVLHTPTKKKRKQWTDEQMKGAMQAAGMALMKLQEHIAFQLQH